ncbi:hypothetical protein V1477_007477 [Vespula maculifrons]|uniref:Uncharacterized protein n=1 Tax=Vespula maculifrons TaxID=7453 RepID=A0ABD2CIM3_VESMC
MQSGDTRLRETTTKSGLKPTFTVTSSVVLWTSTRELRYFRGCHPYKLKCEVGILGFERRQQSRVLNRPLQLLVQLCFGHRQENLEIFADAIFANPNAKWGYSASRDDNNVESLTDLCSSQFNFDFAFSEDFDNLSPRMDLEIFTDAIFASINEGGDTRLRETTTKSGLKPTFTVTSSVVLWTSTRQLRNLVDAIHASINEQLIQIYNSFFDFKLKCEVGIHGFEGRQQSRFPVQLCFGLRRGNLEIFVDAIHT